MIRIMILAAAVLGLLCAADVTPAAARDYPFCIKGRDYDNPVGDCSFDNYRQCQATASGRIAYCDINPFFNGNGEARSASRHRHRRIY